MKLFILFAQPKNSYEGENAPEARLVWDEFCVDANPEGFEAAIEAEKATCLKDGYTAARVITITVDGDKIDRLLNKVPNVAGEVEEP